MSTNRGGRLRGGGKTEEGGRRRSDITAASWVRAANSVITWSHTEEAGRRSCENKHMEAMQEAKPPQNLDLVSAHLMGGYDHC